MENKKARHARWVIPLAISGAALATCASALFFLFAGSGGSGQPALPTREISLGGIAVTAEIAADAEEQRRGLSGRRGLAPDAGMLFPVYPPARPDFWMKEMNFPLDFIYLSGGRVVEIKENILPASFPGFFRPAEDVDAVLEMSAGWAAARSVRVGDSAAY
jgi:uncharacterized membrane protein (UPF0127 family)